jgi:hypothetical protein
MVPGMIDIGWWVITTCTTEIVVGAPEIFGERCEFRKPLQIAMNRRHTFCIYTGYQRLAASDSYHKLYLGALLAIRLNCWDQGSTEEVACYCKLLKAFTKDSDPELLKRLELKYKQVFDALSLKKQPFSLHHPLYTTILTLFYYLCPMSALEESPQRSA